jgi:hypothetical protein
MVIKEWTCRTQLLQYRACCLLLGVFQVPRVCRYLVLPHRWGPEHKSFIPNFKRSLIKPLRHTVLKEEQCPFWKQNRESIPPCFPGSHSSLVSAVYYHGKSFVMSLVELQCHVLYMVSKRLVKMMISDCYNQCSTIWKWSDKLHGLGGSITTVNCKYS